MKIRLLIILLFCCCSVVNAQKFVLRTTETGLNAVSETNGVALADYDQDGDIDIYFVVKKSYNVNDSTTWNRLFANNGDGTFSIVPTIEALRGKDKGLGFVSFGDKNGASWGDYNNDGYPDLYLTNLGPNQLFRNNRDGTFTDVTVQAGVEGGQNQWSGSALWFDYDRDGDLDLYVNNWEEIGPRKDETKNWFYENRGSNNFVDVTAETGLAGWRNSFMTVTIDGNNDGLLDLYTANDFGENNFFLNNGNKTYSDCTQVYGLSDKYNGMGITIADCDANGFFDIYLTNRTQGSDATETNPLFLNTGSGFFVNKARQSGVALAGWGWGTSFLDIENDGDEDLFVVTGMLTADNPNFLFKNVSSDSVVFEDISIAAGINDSTVARGLGVFDYDNDGDPDLLVSNYFEAPFLYENSYQHGNWLKIQLSGTESNRNAFGSTVQVWFNGKTIKKFHHGATYLGQNILPVHFGLAEAEMIDSIVVYWTNGHVENVGPVLVNQTIKIKEKSGIVNSIHALPGNQYLPQAIKLLGNYPNPFNGQTRIRFNIPWAVSVSLNIYNSSGQLVKSLTDTYTTPGIKEITWDGTNARSVAVASGIYFYKIYTDDAPGLQQVRKLVHLK